MVFGATKICHVATDAELTYQIVGEDEANIKLNKISYSSPIGRALIGKELDGYGHGKKHLRVWLIMKLLM